MYKVYMCSVWQNTSAKPIFWEMCSENVEKKTSLQPSKKETYVTPCELFHSFICEKDAYFYGICHLRLTG